MSKKNGSIQVDIDDLKKQNNVLEQQGNLFSLFKHNNSTLF